MKSRYRNDRTAIAYATTLLLAGSVPSINAAETQTVTGRLSVVTVRMVEIDRTQRFEFQPTSAECFDHNQIKMTCETLVGIGYADRARVTLADGKVRRIDILELQQ